MAYANAWGLDVLGHTEELLGGREGRSVVREWRLRLPAGEGPRWGRMTSYPPTLLQQDTAGSLKWQLSGGWEQAA